MGQITIRELENMDFFKEIPKDILQNLLNESKVVSYKKKEVIFHSRSRTKTVYFVYSGEVMLYNLTKHHCCDLLERSDFSFPHQNRVCVFCAFGRGDALQPDEARKQKGDFYPGKRTTVKSEHCEQKAECSFW
mgnify:CR=1 FL=1